jgi:GDPmannose 4,6-dehydratase
MHAMLQKDAPGDYVVATGQTRSVRDFLQAAFQVAGLDYQRYVTVNQEYFRPSEPVPLCGDASLAARELGWAPSRKFEQIVEEMVQSDLALLQATA